MRQAVVLAAILLAASPAAAQTYVSASLVGDVTRFSHVDLPGLDDRGGEAIGFGLRLGTSITEILGVEVEFVRPSTIESTIASEILPASYSPVFAFPGITPLLPELIFPPIRYQLRTETRNTTVATSVWAKQTLTGGFSLVYSAGLALVRSHRATSFAYEAGGGLPLPVPVSYAIVDDAVAYSMQPQVGVEGRIGMGEHVQLVPALRMNGLEDGWSLRPSAGLAWTF